MTILRDALLKAGVEPVQPVHPAQRRMDMAQFRHLAERPPPLVFVDATGFDDATLLNYLAAENATVSDITYQLADDKDAPRDDNGQWRGRAVKARRMAMLRAENLVTEAQRRGLVEAPKTEAALAAERRAQSVDLEHARLERDAERRAQAAELERARLEREQAQAAFNTERLRLATETKIATMQAATERNRMVTSRFVDAARQVLPREQWVAVWDRLRADNPEMHDMGPRD